MLDRKKLILFIAGGVAAIVLIAGVITWFVMSANEQSTNENSTATTLEASPSPTITFTEEQQEIVFEVARLAAAYRATDNDSEVETRYVEAGMSERLARDYKPIWAGYFGSNQAAQINVKNVGSEPSSIEYEPGSTEGSGLFRVGVDVTYDGTYHTGSTTAPIGHNTATWYLILDERSNTVTNIEQPRLADLDLPDPEA